MKALRSIAPPVGCVEPVPDGGMTVESGTNVPVSAGWTVPDGAEVVPAVLVVSIS